MKGFLFALVLFLLLTFPQVVFAHPGRTDSSGCHTCRTNCEKWGLSYGEYHCHNTPTSNYIDSSGSQGSKDKEDYSWVWWVLGGVGVLGIYGLFKKD